MSDDYESTDIHALTILARRLKELGLLQQLPDDYDVIPDVKGRGYIVMDSSNEKYYIRMPFLTKHVTSDKKTLARVNLSVKAFASIHVGDVRSNLILTANL